MLSYLSNLLTFDSNILPSDITYCVSVFFFFPFFLEVVPHLLPIIPPHLAVVPFSIPPLRTCITIALLPGYEQYSLAVSAACSGLCMLCLWI